MISRVTLKHVTAEAVNKLLNSGIITDDMSVHISPDTHKSKTQYPQFEPLYSPPVAGKSKDEIIASLSRRLQQAFPGSYIRHSEYENWGRRFAEIAYNEIYSTG